MNNYEIAFNAIWVWFAVAIAFLVMELLKVNGYSLWLSICAAIVATLKAWFTPLSLVYQLLVFILLGALLCLWWFNSLKRKPVQLNTLKAKEYLGRVYALEKSVKHGKGQLEIDNLIWFVHSERDLPKGTRIKVKGSNGVVLLIEEYIPIN